MNIVKLTLLSLLLAGPILRADPTAVLPSGTTDPLAEAVPILQAKYADFKVLNYRQGDHLSDLIARSNGEISLSGPETSSAPLPIVTALLPDTITYWRLASFTPKKDWGELGTELQYSSTRYPYGGAILDLRGNTEPGDIAGAAQVINYFAPGDDSLFKFRPVLSDGSKLGGYVITDHPFHGPIVVLIDHQTAGAAEVLAARLKADGALLVGQETSGKGAVFGEQKLASGQVLRYVAAHVNLADGTDIWNHPVTPDITMTVDDHTEKAALMLIRDNHILDVIQESAERHRMSEASLVQGEDPEWDDYLASLEKKPVLLSLPIIHDAVLIRALDSLKAIRLSQRPLPAQATANASPPASSSVQ
jgi:hypothetical protein